MPTMRDLQTEYDGLRTRLQQLRAEPADKQASPEWSTNYDALLADMDSCTKRHEKEALAQRLLAWKGEQSANIAAIQTGGVKVSRYEVQENALRSLILNMTRRGAESRPEWDECRQQLGFAVPTGGVCEVPIKLATNSELRIMKVSTAGAGQELVPESFVPAFETELQLAGPMRQLARIQRTASGEDLRWPVGTDNANNAQWVGESVDWYAAANVVADVATGKVTFKAWKTVAACVLSYEMLTDAGFSIGGVLGGLLGERHGRTQNLAFTTGAGVGSSRPNGFVTAALAVAAGAGVQTQSVASAFSFDEIINLQHKLYPAYRTRPCAWQMHDTILALVRKIKDSQLRYIWEPSQQIGVPGTIYGEPVYVNMDMDSTRANGTEYLAYGWWNQYVIRDAGEARLRILTERRAEFDEIIFVLLMRTDGNTLQQTTWTRPPIVVLQGIP